MMIFSRDRLSRRRLNLDGPDERSSYFNVNVFICHIDLLVVFIKRMDRVGGFNEVNTYFEDD